jgi:hypothetical protein
VFKAAGRFFVDNLKQGALPGTVAIIAGHGASSRGLEINTVVVRGTRGVVG